MNHEKDDGNSVSLDTVFDLLTHQRRRYALACLKEHGSLALADLADEVACRENDCPITEVPEDEVLRVYSALWHAHVPKLAAHGVVAYDQERDLVALGENVEAVTRVASLDAIEDDRQASTGPASTGGRS